VIFYSDSVDEILGIIIIIIIIIMDFLSDLGRRIT